MGLSKAINVRVEASGFWVFKRYRVSAGSRDEFELGRSAYAAAFSGEGPGLVAEDGDRRLWRVGNEFYWDTDSLAAEEIGLLVWDKHRRHDSRLDRLRKIRAREEDAEASRRSRIADDVRAHVWARDDGRCVRCQAEDDLQFDHIIPVAKGGSNAPENVQILCGDCNRLKSDSIV